MSPLGGASMIVFGGGACIIPFLNLFGGPKSNSISLPPISHQAPASAEVTSPDSSGTDSRREPEQRPLRETKQIKEKDNCQFKTKKEEGLDSEIGDSYSNYFSFDCDNSGQNEEILTQKWTLWVPKVLLKEGKDTFTEEGQRVNIKTSSSRKSTETDEYETIFDSDIFSKNPIKGIWGRSEDIVGISKEDSEAFIYKFTINSPDESKNNLLYLRWK